MTFFWLILKVQISSASHWLQLTWLNITLLFHIYNNIICYQVYHVMIIMFLSIVDPYSSGSYTKLIIYDLKVNDVDEATTAVRFWLMS